MLTLRESQITRLAIQENDVQPTANAIPSAPDSTMAHEPTRARAKAQTSNRSEKTSGDPVRGCDVLTGQGVATDAIKTQGKRKERTGGPVEEGKKETNARPFF